MSESRIESFEKFWPFYVREHSKKATRVLHFVGTTSAAAVLGAAIATRNPKLIPLALVAGYGPAWISHFFIEKNRPATFTYPVWSLLADLKMWTKIASGTMDAEVEKAMAEVRTPEPEPAPAPRNGVAHSELN
ncbi:MAG: DUF962 domain-containing protein [Polyangiaceae bacterium]